MRVNKRNSLADASPLWFYWVFELHNHSSGCDPWSDSADPRIKAALPTCVSIPCESTKARAVRLTLSVADLQHPSRLRREPTRPRQDTLLDDFKRRHSALNFITSHERKRSVFSSEPDFFRLMQCIDLYGHGAGLILGGPASVCHITLRQRVYSVKQFQ